MCAVALHCLSMLVVCVYVSGKILAIATSDVMLHKTT